MSPADSDRSITPFPTDRWSQPAVTVPDLGESEQVQRILTPASMTYRYNPGLAPTRFLRGLEQKKLIGERCPVTGDVYIPSRGMSPVSGLPPTERVEVGPNASISSFCVVHIGFGTNAPPTPFVSALILPDGASVSLYGTLLEVPHDQVRIGMRVEPVWAPDDELTTSFENVKYWRPIDEPDVPAEDMKGHM